MFVGDGDGHASRAARPARCWRSPDAASASTPTCDPRAATARSCARSSPTRPTGSGGPTPWEFQALLKARPVAGDAELGAAFVEAAAAASVGEALRRRRPPLAAGDEGAGRGRRWRGAGSTDREVKRGRGGIRDIEFAVQLLQLVHGGPMPTAVARTRSTRSRELADGGLRRRRATPTRSPTRTASCGRSSTGCSSSTSSRCTRSRRHRDAADPARSHDGVSRHRVGADALEQLFADLRGTRRRCGRSTSASTSGRCSRPSRRFRRARRSRAAQPPGAAEARLAAFGFTDADRHAAGGARADPRPHPLVAADAADAAAAARLAVRLARPRPRAARPAQPGIGLAALDRAAHRRSATRPRRPGAVPAARHQPDVGDTLLHNPDLVARLADRSASHTAERRCSSRAPGGALPWREDVEERQARPAAVEGTQPARHRGARRARRAPTSLSSARDLTCAGRGVARGRARSRSLRHLPFAVIALGRFGGARAVLRQRPRRAVRVRRRDAGRLRRGRTRRDRQCAGSSAGRRRRPACTSSTPTCGPRASRARWPAASTASPTYFERWALVWERQAMVRARPVAGDRGVGGAVHGAARRLRLGPRRHRRRGPRDPPHEGPDRAGAHPARRGPDVPPQARPGLAVRRRVHRAAAAAAARRARDGDDRRSRPVAERGTARERRPWRPDRGVPVLRAHAKPALLDRRRLERASSTTRSPASAREGVRHLAGGSP